LPNGIDLACAGCRGPTLSAASGLRSVGLERRARATARGEPVELSGGERIARACRQPGLGSRAGGNTGRPFRWCIDPEMPLHENACRQHRSTLPRQVGEASSHRE